MKRTVLILCLLKISLLFSQSKIDSLQLELENTTVDTIKINILHQLFNENLYNAPEKAKEIALKAIQLSEKTDNNHIQVKSYNQYAGFLLSQSNFDTAIVAYKKALEISEKIRFTKGKLKALIGLGNCYRRKGNFKEAHKYQKLHIESAEKRNDQESLANSYKLVADIYTETGEYSKAMESYVLASQKYEVLGKLKELATVFGNMGLVQRRLENYQSAKSYLLESDSIHKKLNYPPGRAYTQYNLAVISKNLGELNQALIFNQEALRVYQSIGYLDRIAHVYYTMGEIYRKKGTLREALENYEKSVDISEQVGDSVNLGYSYATIGDIHHQLNENKKAKEYLLKAISTAKGMNQQDLLAMEGYKSLSEVYASEGDYYQAYENKSRYAEIRDSFYTREKRDLANEIEAKYQNEQKAKEIALLSSEKDLQTLQIEKRIGERNAIIALAVIMLIMVGLLYNQYRTKQKANQKLKELDRLKSNFFANISHEFRTPLTLIKGPIEQLEQNPDEQLSMDNIKMMRRNANRVLKLVNQLLDLSKIDGGSLQLEPTEGDLFKCLRAATASFNSHAAQRSIDYRVQIPPTVLWTSFDRDKLEKVVYNLLSNAFKFSDDGSMISCEVKFEESCLKIQIADTGNGIPEEKLPFVFDRFYQVNSRYTKEKEGTGIGLSLSKDLVELMDGTITVSSEINKGSFFALQIPFQEIKTRSEELLEVVPKESVGELKPEPFTITKTDKRELPFILLVEDNKDMRHFIRESLIKFYKIKEATNGEAGLMEAVANPPDLIITDLMMPEMDGLTFCKKLKTDVNTSHIPVIMLTAKTGIDHKIEGLEIGADDYLTKPFDVNELLIRVKNLIEQREKLRKLFGNNEVWMDPKKITVTSIDQEFLERVLALLESKFSEPEFSVTQMQESLAMSKSQLHRKIKALTNETPGELLRNFRLKRAAQLIAQKADNVTQIAYQVGFNNLSYFAKCYKELYGVAPSSHQKPLHKSQ